MADAIVLDAHLAKVRSALPVLKAAGGTVASIAVSQALMERIKVEYPPAPAETMNIAGITLAMQPLLPDGIAQIRFADGRMALWNLQNGNIINVPRHA